MTEDAQTIQTDMTWTPAQCARLLERLRPGQQLEFYAADHPSVSDPGAYIWVQRQDDKLLRKAANHGWSTDWTAVTLPELQAELYRNRAEQVHGVRLAAARRPAKEKTK